MEEAFIRAELFIKALQNCSPSTRAADVKAYVTALDKELKIIKREAQVIEQKHQTVQSPFKLGVQKPSLLFTKVPPPEVSSDKQAEKK